MLSNFAFFAVLLYRGYAISGIATVYGTGNGGNCGYGVCFFDLCCLYVLIIDCNIDK